MGMKHQENDVKETKKTRRKRSARTVQQIKLAVIMIMVSVLVLSASTFAWYQMSKMAKVTNMQFTADTIGNLQISEDNVTYSNVLNLELNKDDNKKVLLPATTADGKSFFKPTYDDDGLKVISVDTLSDESDEFSQYVYKKDFYIKSGNTIGTQKYDLKLSASNSESSVGTYIKDAADAGTGFTALNAVRIGFVFDSTEGVTIPNTGDVTIYEPYSEGNTNDGTQANKDAVSTSYGPTKYDATLTLKQKSDGSFPDRTLCTITEGNPVKVTMYVWFEGNDEDCENEIALDTIAGQIQFEATTVTTP